MLKLNGEDTTQVADAKEALGRVLVGEVMRQDGRDLWSASLADHGVRYKKLRQVEREHGVVILPDKRKSQLRLFGPENSSVAATAAIVKLVQDASSDISSDVRVFELTSDQFNRACQGGFKTLTACLGQHKTTFDIVSSPKRILVSGSDKDYSKAMALISSR